MNTNRYCFSYIGEDDELRSMSVRAKELLQQNDNIVKIFHVNKEVLSGQSPKQVLFLMKQNKKSMFSSGSSPETSPSGSKSYEKVSTPFRQNPETSNMPRRLLPLDDEEKNVHQSTTQELSSPTGRQKAIVNPSVQEILNPTIDEPSTSEKQFVSPGSSTTSSEADGQESPRSAQIAKMTENLSMTEKEFESPKKGVGTIDECSKGSPSSAEVAMITSSLNTMEKECDSPVKEVSEIQQGNQESPLSAEIARKTSFITLYSVDSSNRTQDEKMAGNTEISRDSPNSEENVSKFENPDLYNKYFIGEAEGKETLSSSANRSETPSPVKRFKIGRISSTDTQELSSPTEKVKLEENSPENTKATISPLQEKLNISPNKSIAGIERYDRKRKSLSPRRRTTALLRSIPRVVELPGEDIRVEVTNLEYYASPTTSRSKSADYRIESIKDCNKSPDGGESKANTSHKTSEPFLNPSERTIPIGSPNSPGTSSPRSGNNAFSGKYASGNSSIVATPPKNRSFKTASSSPEIKSDPFSLEETIFKFETLLALRDQAAKKSFVSLQTFQSSIDFMLSYFNNLSNVLLNFYLSGKYSENEFNETVTEANVIYLKLIKKINSWKKDVNLDIYAWQKCFQQIQQLKAQYEPLLTDVGKPAVPLEDVQVYESEMKAIWKKMDGMIMLGDSRRALFSHIAPDVERLIKMLIKCLVHVGILQPQ